MEGGRGEASGVEVVEARRGHLLAHLLDVVNEVEVGAVAVVSAVGRGLHTLDLHVVLHLLSERLERLVARANRS
eukprot:1446926-Pyramimonas_sp.AAC.1